MLVDRYGYDLFNAETVGMGSLTLRYVSSTILSATVNLNKQLSGTPIPLVTLYKVNGTPYQNVKICVASVSGNQLTIEAIGSGFVSAHLLDVRYIVFDKH